MRIPSACRRCVWRWLWPAASPAAPRGRAKEILVGEYGSLTGGIATFGISTQNGSELAFDEINAEGRRARQEDQAPRRGRPVQARGGRRRSSPS